MLMSFFFFFNDTATTEIYTLSLHDALPISSFMLPAAGLPAHARNVLLAPLAIAMGLNGTRDHLSPGRDRKSTRLNSSHQIISYAVFCLKKKKNKRSAIHQLSAHRACEM